jgi:hypothetical protein
MYIALVDKAICQAYAGLVDRQPAHQQRRSATMRRKIQRITPLACRPFSSYAKYSSTWYVLYEALCVQLFSEAALFLVPTRVTKERRAVGSEEQHRDILLFAYVDGELDAAQRRLVEDLLARDPEARQRVAQMRELNALLKAAYDEDGGETI